MGSAANILNSLSGTGADAGLGIEAAINALVGTGSTALQGGGAALSA